MHFGRGGALGRGRGRTLARLGIAPSIRAGNRRLIRRAKLWLWGVVHEKGIMEELLEDLSLSRTASIEQSSGYNLFDVPLALSPPLAPTTSPVTSSPPVPLSSPSPGEGERLS